MDVVIPAALARSGAVDAGLLLTDGAGERPAEPSDTRLSTRHPSGPSDAIAAADVVARSSASWSHAVRLVTDAVRVDAGSGRCRGARRRWEVRGGVPTPAPPPHPLSTAVVRPRPRPDGTPRRTGDMRAFR